MEKFIFLATIKERLIEMNVSEDTAEKHVKIFEECLKGKSADEIDKVIKSAGGVDGIVRSICNLEEAKKKNAKTKESDNLSFEAETEPNDKTVSMGEESELKSDESIEKTVVMDKIDSKEELTLDVFSDEPKVSEKETNASESPEVSQQEIEKSPDIEEHIREAEEITAELEKTTVNKVLAETNKDEYELDISEYDFDTLFAEKLTIPEKGIKKLREKMSPTVFKCTLPIAVIIFAALFAVVSVLFPALFISAIASWAAYIALLVSGTVFSLVPFGYGIYMCFKNMTIALYELSICCIAAGITMFSCIILYNYAKRLVPFLFKMLKKLFKYCVRLTKRYFKTVKKEDK